MKSVEVLMSTYNGEKYIEEQVKSIFKQDDVDVRLLVRDDGSIDETINILKKLQQEHNINIIKGKNLGFAQSFWQLILNADEADYYAFCDQDDFWMEKKLITAINTIESKSAINIPVLYTGNVVEVDSNLSIIKEKGFSVDRVLNLRESLEKSVLPGCTFVFNALLLKQLKKYRDNKMIAHDWLIYIIANLTGVVLYDPKPQMYYRIHENNTIGIDSELEDFKKKIYRFFKPSFPNARSTVAKEIYDIFKIEVNESDKEDLYNFCHYKFNLVILVKLLKIKDYSIITKILFVLGKV